MLPGDVDLRLDGASVPAVVNFTDQGIDDETGEPYLNAGYVDISGSTSGLLDGAHVASIAVKDSANSVWAHSWTFNVSVPPTFSDKLPATGTSSVTPLISAKVTDNSTTPMTVTMLLDGEVVPAVFDQSTRVVSYTPSAPLANGIKHTVRVDARDASGAASSTTWQFLVQAFPTISFSSAVPAAGSVITADRPLVAVTAAGSANLDRTTALLSVDGVPISTIALAVGGDTKTMALSSYGCPSLPDGQRTFRADIADVTGFWKSYEWRANVQIPPSVSVVEPPDGTVAPSLTPTIVLSTSDNTSGNVTIRLLLDGTPLTTQSAPQGSWTYTLPQALAAGSTHTAVATVTDAAGLVSSTTWSFAVAAGDSIGVSACTECHTAYPAGHTAVDCYASCHIHPDYAGASGACGGCHSFGSPHGSQLQACESCHGADGPHGGTAIEAPHLSTGLAGDCGACHQTYLHREHDRVSTASGAQIECVSCHGGPDHVPASMLASVTAALASNDTACAACHKIADAHTEVHDSVLAGACTGCHSANIAAQHGSECGVCHESGDPDVIAAIADHDLACATCHGFSSHEEQHVSTTTDTCFGEGCHATTRNLLDVHAPLVGAGSPNPEYATSCELCHDNPAVDPATAGLACTGACHVGETHAGREAGHAFESEDSLACAECHGQTIEEAHGAYSDLTRCAWCHADPANWQRTVECAECHPRNPHPDADHTVTSGCIAAGCHQADATAIHETVGCKACHAKGKTPSFACSTCHDANMHESLHASAETCTSCHAIGNLVPIHGRDCAVCHPGPADTAWDGRCRACHSDPHAAIDFDHQQDHSATEYGSDCWSCHAYDGPDWQCRTCHPERVDATAPVTTSDARSTYAGGARITLAATDAGGSGVGTVWWRLDGGVVRSGTVVDVTAPASEPETHTLEFWATDNALNSESPKAVTFAVYPAESSPPITVSDVASSYLGAAAIHLTAADVGGSGVKATYYRLDGGALVTGSDILVKPPVAGSVVHTLEYWSVDFSGNVEATQRATFTIVAPVAYGTVTFAWNGPAEGSWAEVWVKDSAGKVVYYQSSPNWAPVGWFVATVPVSTTPYRLEASWYDAGEDYQDFTRSSALINVPNKNVTWWY